MTRAERRRQEKAAKKKEAVYNFTKPQIDGMIQEGIEKELAGMKAEIYSKAVNDAMILLLTLPMIVLMEDYWQKSFQKRIPVFIEKVFNLYEKWKDDEIDIEDLKTKLWEVGGMKFVESER